VQTRGFAPEKYRYSMLVIVVPAHGNRGGFLCAHFLLHCRWLQPTDKDYETLNGAAKTTWIIATAFADSATNDLPGRTAIVNI